MHILNKQSVTNVGLCMARKLRLQYEGAIYHVMNRGDRREDIFVDDKDRIRFLETLGETCSRTSWQVHAYCLMPNHFHLVMETPRANLVSGMQWLLGTYTARFNRRHKYFGHLFSGRYKSLLVDGSGSGYLRTVCNYVHLNPVRANLLDPRQPLNKYRWASYAEYLKPAGRRPVWLRTDRLLGEWGVTRDDSAGRKHFESGMEQYRELEQSASNGNWKRLRRGWCFGNDSFRKELLQLIGHQQAGHHYGDETRESDAEKAERLVAEMLRHQRWTEAELAGRRKGDKLKVQMARQLRKETTMTWSWIAQRLQMGHWRSAANVVRLS